MNRLYPIFLNIADQTCLVIGGGAVAERKVAALLDCGARVVVFAPQAAPGLRSLSEQGKIVLRQEAYVETALEELTTGRSLVFIATDDRETNRRIFEDASNRGLAVNTVDDPILCNFFVPAVVRRGSLSIAVSTEGKSPMLARRIRESLEQQFGTEYDELLDILGECREKVLASRLDEPERKKLFRELVYSDLLELLREGQKELAKERASKCLSSWLD